MAKDQFCEYCGVKITLLNKAGFSGKSKEGNISCSKCARKIINNEFNEKNIKTAQAYSKKTEELQQKHEERKLETEKKIEELKRQNQLKDSTSAPIHQYNELERKWYLFHDNKRIGPVTFLAIQNLLKNGKINESTLVWCQGMEGWSSLNEIEELINDKPEASISLEHTPDPRSDVSEKTNQTSIKIYWLGCLVLSGLVLILFFSIKSCFTFDPDFIKNNDVNLQEFISKHGFVLDAQETSRFKEHKKMFSDTDKLLRQADSRFNMEKGNYSLDYYVKRGCVFAASLYESDTYYAPEMTKDFISIFAANDEEKSQIDRFAVETKYCKDNELKFGNNEVQDYESTLELSIYEIEVLCKVITVPPNPVTNSTSKPWFYINVRPLRFYDDEK